MERLTQWGKDKLLAKPKFSGDYGSSNILCRLAEFEDLGYEPDELKDIIEKIKELEESRQKINKKLIINNHIDTIKSPSRPTCPAKDISYPFGD